jgi:diacylglycerol kinase (ATP)
MALSTMAGNAKLVGPGCGTKAAPALFPERPPRRGDGDQMSDDAAGRSRRRALLVVNRKARSGLTAIDEAMQVLEAGGIDIMEAEMVGREQICAEIREDAAEIDMVILGGGDGTLNAAAPALVETGLPLGILPLGTANDLARTLGLPTALNEAAQVIADGHSRAIDLGEVNGVFYFNVASVGFSAMLARRLTSEAKKRWGAFGYALAAARILSESTPFRVELVHDGRMERARTLQVSVGNGRYYGGGMAVEEDARADDGRLDVYSLETPHWWHLIKLAPALRRGTQGRSKYVRAFHTTELSLWTRRRHDVNADGELVTTTPARFTVRPRAVRVFVPQ